MFLDRVQNIRLMTIFVESGIVLVFFSYFEKNYLLLSYATSVRPSVSLSSVEIIFSVFRGNLISNRPIDLKIGLNVR